MKCLICMSVQLNILCLICINRQYPENCIAIAMTHEFCSIFFWNTVKQGRSLTHNSGQNSTWPPFALITILSCLAADQSFGSVYPGFAEPRSRSELASPDQCLKFCDVTQSATMVSTLNNTRDLDLDCSAVSFLVQRTQAHWNAGKHGAPSCLITKSLFAIRLIASSKPYSIMFSQ